MVVKEKPDLERERERLLTRRIARIEREGVLVAGRSFCPDISDSALRLIEARLIHLDSQREKLLEERALLRRARLGRRPPRCHTRQESLGDPNENGS